MSDTTKAPHCPMCGWEIVRKTRRELFGEPLWLAQCSGCGFGCDDELTTKADAQAEARRLVRAELARQALEMRAHSFALDPHYDAGGKHCSLEFNLACAMHDYAWLGANPLRLPGEEA